MRNVTRLDSAGGDHLMGITKLSTVFEIFESEDEAIRSFGLEPV
jgi:hypothetical protein